MQQAFAADPDLFRFVASAPSDSARDAFARWAAKLNSHISDSPPPLPTSGAGTYAAPAEAPCPAAEAPLLPVPSQALRRPPCAAPAAAEAALLLPRLALHLCCPPCGAELDTPLGGWSWTPTVEALAILRELSTAQVTRAA